MAEIHTQMKNKKANKLGCTSVKLNVGFKNLIFAIWKKVPWKFFWPPRFNQERYSALGFFTGPQWTKSNLLTGLRSNRGRSQRNYDFLTEDDDYVPPGIIRVMRLKDSKVYTLPSARTRRTRSAYIY